jgi:hypothetical protein
MGAAHLFNNDHANHRPAPMLFQRNELELLESANRAGSMGDPHGRRKRHTSFDLWHLGTARSLSAGAFLTFDKTQKKSATLLGIAG